jgi:hypothetical protein
MPSSRIWRPRRHDRRNALNAAPEDKPLLHPNLAAIYRTRVENLEAALREPHHDREAFEVVRGLVEEVRIIPAEGEITIELRGELAGILAVAETAKKGFRSHQDKALQIKMVAGARNRHYLLFNALRLPRLHRCTVA